MFFAPAADRLHRALRSNGLLQRFTLLCRTLLTLGFVAPGLVKVAGDPFSGFSPPPGASIEELPVILAYFEVFHRTGAYYSFVGAAQAGAGLLLLSRRTALLGAMLYLPVIANISVLTVATNFGPLLGTQLVTVLMVLACGWLLLWDAHRLMPLFTPHARSVPARAQEPALWQMLVPRPGSGGTRAARLMLRGAWLLGFAGAMAVLLLIRGPRVLATLHDALLLPAALAVPAAGALAIVGWGLWWWTGKRRGAAASPR